MKRFTLSGNNTAAKMLLLAEGVKSIRFSLFLYRQKCSRRYRSLCVYDRYIPELFLTLRSLNNLTCEFNILKYPYL